MSKRVLVDANFYEDICDLARAYLIRAGFEADSAEAKIACCDPQLIPEPPKGEEA